MSLLARLLLCLIWATFLAGQRCPVYTFFHDVSNGRPGGLEDDTGIVAKDQVGVIRTWLRNWWSRGWDPRVVGLELAQQHPCYRNFTKAVTRFPTVNPPDYELMCYIRWLAFQQVGGDVFVDYDVMNFSLDMLPRRMGQEGDGLVSFHSVLPMLLFGSAPSLDRLIHAIGNYTVDEEKDRYQGLPHVSDMTIAQRMQTSIFATILPTPPGLWHFTTSSKYETGVWQVMQMAKAEWIDWNLQAEFRRLALIRYFGEREDDLDPAMASLLRPLLTPWRPDQEAWLLEGLRGALHHRPRQAAFQITTRLDPYIYPETGLDLVLFEPVEERILRPYVQSPQLRLLGDSPQAILETALRPERLNWVVRALSDCSLEAESMDACLERAKARLRAGDRMFVGFLEHLEDTKMLLEYTIGFSLAPLTEPYIRATLRHALAVPEGVTEAIRGANWADHDLYQYALGLFQERLQPIRPIEAQATVEKLYSAPVAS